MQIKRIIPCLDLKDGRVVKGVNFVNLIDAGDPVEAAMRYNDMGADEIVFLDITASYENRATTLDVIKRASKKVSIPITVGGGIRTAEDFGRILDSGADKISINSAAVNNPELISQAAKEFGGARVIVAIDAKKNTDGIYQVYTGGGRKNTGLDVIKWAKQAQNLGAGEILLTSMDADGTKSGFDIELTKVVASAVKIPVTASGGAGKKEHFLQVLTEGKASAALAASLFHFRQLEISDLKNYLQKNNIQVRIV